MHYIGNYLLWALAVSILCQGSFAEDQLGYICLIEDPIQNQCDSICLTELSPRLNEVVKAQNEGNTKLETLEEKIGEVQLRERLRIVENRLNGQLQGVESKLVGQLQGVEKKLEGQLQEVQTKLEAKLDESLLAVQKMIEIQLQAVVNKLQAVPNKIDAAKVETQVHPISNKTAAPQQAAKAGVPASDTITKPSGFELIGTRYFKFVNERWNLETAERRCREMGGYLASFRNEDEFNAITQKLDKNRSYWLGINDRENEGHFVSVASHKPAQFLKWKEGQPNDKNHEENCVDLFDAEMWDSNCNDSLFFICQVDNET